MKLFLVLTAIFFFQFSVQKDDRVTRNTDDLYTLFRNPPAEAKPFVRWWWNGNRVEEKEVLRELDLLKRAGFGGVEINPIAMPPVTGEPSQEALEWLSPQWNEVLKAACLGAKERGMIADLLVGSGWPFGGKFLQPDQTIERMAINYKEINGLQTLRLSVVELENDLPAEYLRGRLEQESKRILKFVRLIPVQIDSPEQIIDLTPMVENGMITYEVPEGQYRLAWGVLQKGFREVVYGTLGADGPTMNHLDAEVTKAFLARLKEIERDLGIPLADLIRALFCDSIELAGSNWCADFAEEFEKRCGYSLDPYYPFIFYYSKQPYPYEIDNQAFDDLISRVKYDYNRVLVDLFQERFTAVFKDFCEENNLLCRFQAYGNPWLIGILDGYLQADIPESNNWFYVQNSRPDAEDHFTWVKNHGSLIWNKYAAAGAHLTDRNIVSCEAMTNLDGVFKASLSTIKQADDMNFITGITHSVLHGFNYSPPDAGFPGWIRYGTFFSEHNTLWPHFTNWLRYSARVSAVLQNSDPVVPIAILAPEADTWSKHGLRRVPFHMEPWYVFDMWEGISQNGSSCDYVNERVIQQAKMKKGKMNFGPMKYETLILADVKSMDVQTAKQIYLFVKNGGKVICIGQTPDRATSFSEANQDDQVSSWIQKIKSYKERARFVEAPAEGTDITSWTEQLFNTVDFEPCLDIKTPSRSLYQIHHRLAEADIFFITNTNRKIHVNTKIGIDAVGRKIVKWDAVNGSQSAVHSANNSISLNLKPLESIILVIEPGEPPIQTPVFEHHHQNISPAMIEGSWQATFEPVAGKSFTRTFTELIDFKESDDSLLQHFAGKVIYTLSFDATETNFSEINLGIVNDGVTRVTMNGMSLGTQWYGEPSFDISDQMRLGPNTLEIEYTSLLWNYCKSVDKVETNRWIRGRDLISNGLQGPVILR